MSYILDALKRSEQERNQGQIPGFVDHNNMLLLSKKSRPTWPYWLAAALLLNVAGLAWIYYANQQRSPAESAATVYDESLPASAEPQSVEVVREKSTQSGTSAADTAMAASVTLPSQPVVTIRPRVARAQNLEQANRATQNPALDQELIEPVHAERASALATAEQTVPPKAQPIEVSADSPTGGIGVEAPNDAPRVTVASLPIDTAGVQDTPYANVELLSELDARFQSSVPRLIFNSHIYSDIPDARRVMINNIYLREGQVFSGIQVKEIGEHSIVFEKQGRLFRLPVMRDWMG